MFAVDMSLQRYMVPGPVDEFLHVRVTCEGLFTCLSPGSSLEADLNGS